MKTRSLLLVAAVALATAAQAQRFGGMMRGFQTGPMASAMLLTRTDVQEELKLTDDEKGKLDAQQATARQRMRDAFMQLRNNGGDWQEGMKSMQPLFESTAKEALAVLTDDQRKRLGELALQVAGNRAVLQPDVAKELGITEAQKAKIDDLQRMQDEANQSLVEKAQNQEIEWSEMGEKMQSNQKALDKEIDKLLTSAQRAKLKEMSGTAFEFKDPKPGTPGAFGRPGGGR